MSIVDKPAVNLPKFLDTSCLQKDFLKTVDYTKIKSNLWHVVKNLQTLGKKYPEKKILATLLSDNWHKLNERKVLTLWWTGVTNQQTEMINST